jgi:hypothetical protein
MMHVNQECRSLSSWKYQNYAKETMAITSKHQATMRMIHPATNLEMDTTEAPQQQQQGDGNEHDEQKRDGDWIDPNSRNKPSCPHYRQLTDDDSRTAQKTFAQIVPQATSTDIVLYAKRGGERQGLVCTILKTCRIACNQSLPNQCLFDFKQSPAPFLQDKSHMTTNDAGSEK